MIDPVVFKQDSVPVALIITLSKSLFGMLGRITPGKFVPNDLRAMTAKAVECVSQRQTDAFITLGIM